MVPPGQAWQALPGMLLREKEGLARWAHSLCRPHWDRRKGNRVRASSWRWISPVPQSFASYDIRRHSWESTRFRIRIHPAHIMGRWDWKLCRTYEAAIERGIQSPPAPGPVAPDLQREEEPPAEAYAIETVLIHGKPACDGCFSRGRRRREGGAQFYASGFSRRDRRVGPTYERTA